MGSRTPLGLHVLLLPALAILGLFAASVLTLFAEALRASDGSLSTVYFREILSRPDYHAVFARTVLISVTVAVVAVALAYPIALLLWASPRWRNLLLVVVLVPWLVSLVVRTYGWMVILGPKGVLNEALRWLGLVSSPLPLMFNDFGVVLGLTHVLMPFSVIAALSVLLQIDPRLQEASESLGAGPLHTLARVILPLSLPGLFNGLAITFLTSMGAIVTPVLLGGLQQKMAGTQIYSEVVYTFNINKASAWALTLLVLSAIGLVLINLLQHWLSPRGGRA